MGVKIFEASLKVGYRGRGVLDGRLCRGQVSEALGVFLCKFNLRTATLLSLPQEKA